MAGPAWRAAWEGRAEPTSNAGAAAEADVLRSIYSLDRSDFLRRVSVVLLPGASDADIPDGLHGVPRHRISPSAPSRYEGLLRALTGQSRYPLPPLGPPATLPPVPVEPSKQASSSHSHRYSTMTDSLHVDWREHWSRHSESARAAMTLHCLPCPQRPIAARERAEVARSLPVALSLERRA